MRPAAVRRWSLALRAGCVVFAAVMLLVALIARPSDWVGSAVVWGVALLLMAFYLIQDVRRRPYSRTLMLVAMGGLVAASFLMGAS